MYKYYFFLFKKKIFHLKFLTYMCSMFIYVRFFLSHPVKVLRFEAPL